MMRNASMVKGGKGFLRGRSELLFWRAALKEATTSSAKKPPKPKKGEERCHSSMSRGKAGVFHFVHKRHIISLKTGEAYVVNGDSITEM